MTLGLLVACGGGGGGGGGGDIGGGDGGGADTALTTTFYPLNVGDTRTWRTVQGAEAGTVRTDRVTTFGKVGSRQAYTVASSNADVEYLSLDPAGITGVPGPGSDPLTAGAGPVDALRFGVVAGQAVVLFDGSFDADVDGDGMAERLELRVGSTFVGLESVNTAAGSFPGSARVTSTFRATVRPRSGAASTLDLTVDEWYAPGVGPVRSVATTVGAGGTTVDVEELMAYRVGSRRSEEASPSLAAGTPAVDAEVGADERPMLRFSEALDPLSLNGPDGAVLVNAAGVAVSTTRTWTRNGTELTLNPVMPLADGRYELRLGSAVTDLAGNALPALVRTFSVDTVGPRLVSSTPAQGDDEVSLTPTITLVFDEPVFVDAGRSPLFRLSDGVDTTFNLRGSVAGRELRLTLPLPLERNRSYSVELDSLVVDALGYPVGLTRLSFRTEPGPLSRPTALDDGAQVYAVTQGDINGDGRSDLVYAAQRLGSEDFYIGARLRLAEGGSGAPTRLATLDAAGICDPRNLEVGHADADGRADIAVTGCAPVGSNWVVLRQTTAGRFVSEVPTLPASSFVIGTLDADGDGRAEFVVQERVGGVERLKVVRRNGTGAWVSVLVLDGGSEVISDFAFADLDGNGQRDPVWLRGLPNNTDWELAWAPRQGAGFGAVRSLALPTGLDSAPVLAVGDMNQDGRPDAMLLLKRVPPGEGSAVSELRVLRNNGTGGFALAQTLDMAPNVAVAAVGDLDGDGRADVVVAHSTLRRVGVLLQGSDGRLQVERLFESDFGYFEGVDALALLDFDGDGLRDLVVTGNVLLGRPTAGAWPLADLGSGKTKAGSAGSAAVVPGSLAAQLRRVSRH